MFKRKEAKTWILIAMTNNNVLDKTSSKEVLFKSCPPHIRCSIPLTWRAAKTFKDYFLMKS